MCKNHILNLIFRSQPCRWESLLKWYRVLTLLKHVLSRQLDGLIEFSFSQASNAFQNNHFTLLPFLIIIISYQSKDVAIWPSSILYFTCISSQPTGRERFASCEALLISFANYIPATTSNGLFFKTGGCKNYDYILVAGQQLSLTESHGCRQKT